MWCNLQQKIQSAFSCPQSGKTVVVGEFPDAQAGSLPVSHSADTPQKIDELQPDSSDSRIDSVVDKTSSFGQRGRNFAVRMLILPVRFYQLFISPLFPPLCRFHPTCSQYAIEALQKRGIPAGVCLTIWRILRCHPFCKGGYDPVPEHGFRNRCHHEQNRLEKSE